MSKFGLVILLILMTGGTYAQDYFIFIHADSKTPFYTRTGDKVYSSSSGGHLILSGLKDSSYTLTIGLAGQPTSERRYIINIDHSDHDYRIRRTEGSSWSLFDERSGEEKLPQTAGGGGEVGVMSQPPGLKKDDAFSRLMAGVVNDTSVLYNTYAMEPAAKDSPVAKQTTPATSPISKQNPTADATQKQNPSTDPALKQNSPTDLTQKHNSPADSTLKQSSPADLAQKQNPSADTALKQTASISVDSAQKATGSTTIGVDSAVSTDPVAAPAMTPPTRSVSATDSFREEVSKVSAPKPKNVVKLSERKLPNTLRLAYADRSTGKKADTIIVFIPVDSPAVTRPKPTRTAADTTNTLTAKTHPAHPDSTKIQSPKSRLTNPDTPKSQTAKLHQASPDSPGSQASKPHLTSSDTPKAQTPELFRRPADTPHKASTAKSSPAFVNSDCHNFATDYDVDKLRVRLLDAPKDDDKILAAKKVFKTRCFSTKQIRALSEIFTNDAAKFRFFEAAYPFCSDSQFRELGSLLADPVYNSKFRAMTER